MRILYIFLLSLVASFAVGQSDCPIDPYTQINNFENEVISIINNNTSGTDFNCEMIDTCSIDTSQIDFFTTIVNNLAQTIVNNSTTSGTNFVCAMTDTCSFDTSQITNVANQSFTTIVTQIIEDNEECLSIVRKDGAVGAPDSTCYFYPDCEPICIEDNVLSPFKTVDGGINTDDVNADVYHGEDGSCTQTGFNTEQPIATIDIVTCDTDSLSTDYAFRIKRESDENKLFQVHGDGKTQVFGGLGVSNDNKRFFSTTDSEANIFTQHNGLTDMQKYVVAASFHAGDGSTDTALHIVLDGQVPVATGRTTYSGKVYGGMGGNEDQSILAVRALKFNYFITRGITTAGGAIVGFDIDQEDEDDNDWIISVYMHSNGINPVLKIEPRQLPIETVAPVLAYFDAYIDTYLTRSGVGHVIDLTTFNDGTNL